MKDYKLEIWHDTDTERPDETALGRMVSFNRRHINFTDPDTIDHGDVLANLSYYEHGLCKWMVGASTVPDPYDGFDTVNLAGVIVWNGDDDEREWWFDELTDDRRRDILDGIALSFTEWSNGETYGYTIETRPVCETCGTVGVDAETIDSLGGIIGTEFLAESIREALSDYDIDPTNVHIGGEYGYVIQESDLMPDLMPTKAGSEK